MITYAQRMDAVKAENARTRPAAAATDFKVWREWQRECCIRFHEAEKAHTAAHYAWAGSIAA